MLPRDRQARFAASPSRQAPCGCKWYEDGTTYKCLSHRPLETGGVRPNGKAGVILNHPADTR